MRAWHIPCRHVWACTKQQHWQTPARRNLNGRGIRIAELLQNPPPHDSSATTNITVHGFVRSVRKQKRVAFAAIGDGSTMQSLQIVLNPHDADKLSNGAAVAITGKWISSTGKKQAYEIQADSVEILGENDATSYPIQKKYHTAEFLRTLPHLRPRIPFNALLLQLRSKVIADMTHFFAQSGYVQIHTPVITSSDCEGAGEVFEVGRPQSAAETAADHDAGRPVTEKFFRSSKYLTVSSQLHLEAMAQAVGRVWTLSPTFRAEESDTPRHLSEFYMLEAEVAFVSRVGDVMDVVEDMIRFIASELQTSNIGQELLDAKSLAHEGTEEARSGSLLNANVVSTRWAGLVKDPWPRITYHQACKILREAEAEGKVCFEESAGPETGLQTEHERYIAEVVGQAGPVFVTDYPASVKPFYMAPSASDAADLGPVSTVACFDLLLPDVCEVAGGSMREHRLHELQEMMCQKGLLSPVDQQNGNLDWYMDLRRYGSVPHGGFGLGFDRLLGYLAGVSNIRDVVAFPRYYGRCLC